MNKLLSPTEVLQALIDEKKVEFYGEDTWRPFNHLTGNMLILMNKYNLWKFRLAQEMITIGNVSFPKPHQGEIEQGQTCYFPCFEEPSLYDRLIWENNFYCDRMMKSGMAHLILIFSLSLN